MSVNLKRPNKKNILSISGINLSDFLIIRKWVDYAKGLKDPTVNLFKENEIIHRDIYDRAKTRRKFFSA